METTLTIYQILGITGGSGLFGAIVVSLIDHLFIKSRELKAKQWEIKKDACLQALSVIDSFFSHIRWEVDGKMIENIQKQSSLINEAREAQSKLILTCNDTKLINKFNEILFSKNESGKKPTELLDEFRNLLRKELGFGKKIDLDKEKSWYGKIHGMVEKQ